MTDPQSAREQEIRARVDAAVREALEGVARVLVEGGDVLAADEVRKHATAGTPIPVQGDLYFCPTVGEIESKTHGGFDTCCAYPDKHVDVPDVPGVQAISEYLSSAAKRSFTEEAS